eukprot:TRINITY_DN14006_c0_g1_i3.p2 TRINITY_DN14006_c0_g1~~TRINITY_DN14006_c0_g1_i3.p2  ORF type:complete len:101 (-),score=13.45 TRINITY_DN14006_c0_g1_i3:373-675(-)
MLPYCVWVLYAQGQGKGMMQISWNSSVKRWQLHQSLYKGTDLWVYGQLPERTSDPDRRRTLTITGARSAAVAELYSLNQTFVHPSPTASLGLEECQFAST